MEKQRDIRFRAWDKDKKEMKEAGYLFPAVSFGGSLFDYIDGDSVSLDEDFVLMQYVGLKDKNGKEIYERDLIRRVADGNEPRALFQVIWDDKHSCFYMTDKDNSAKWPLQENMNFTIIGNIYENPDLLN